MCYTFLLSLICIPFLDEPSPDKVAFRRILEAVYSPLEDLSCEYEGAMSFPQATGEEAKGFGPGGLYDEYSGVYVSRSDGAVFIDIYHRQHPKLQLSRETVGMVAGKCEEFSRSVDAPYGGGSISSAHFQRVERLGSLGKIMCDTLIMGYLRGEDWAMSSGGYEIVDGHRCAVITFSLINNPKYFERFWIDLNRGGQALKRELVVDGTHISQQMKDITLEQLVDGSGSKHWIPISGTYTAMGSVDQSGTLVFGSKPTNLETYHVLRESVRFNTHPPDKRFSAGFRDGTLISDNLRNLQYEFGRAKPEAESLNRAQTEAILNEQIRIAEQQGDELKAPSWERSEAGVLAWAPWFISAALLLIVAGVLLRRKRQAA